MLERLVITAFTLRHALVWFALGLCAMLHLMPLDSLGAGQGSSPIATTQWMQGVLLGTVGTMLAVATVALLGFAALTGEASGGVGCRLLHPVRRTGNRGRAEVTGAWDGWADRDLD